MSFALATDTRFALRCDMTAAISFHMLQNEDCVAELEKELLFRQQSYPTRIAKNGLSPTLAQYQINIWTAIIADYRSCITADGYNGHMGLGKSFNWHDKVTELRREIDMRRKLYPRAIARAPALNVAGTGAGNGAGGNDYRMKLAYLECVHHFYWYHLAFSGIGRDIVRNIITERNRHYVGDWLNLSDPAILPDTDYWLRYAKGAEINITMARRGADLLWHKDSGDIVPARFNEAALVKLAPWEEPEATDYSKFDKSAKIL